MISTSGMRNTTIAKATRRMGNNKLTFDLLGLIISCVPLLMYSDLLDTISSILGIRLRNLPSSEHGNLFFASFIDEAMVW